MEPGTNSAGKKVFFLYPHSVITSEIFDVLIMAGFETYALWDAKRARRLLEIFPDSIMFINIDEGLEEAAWEQYILEIQGNPKTLTCRLGIMSYNADQALMHKYLMELSIPCGYIRLKLGARESARIILAALEANEARGRRRAIRADCGGDKNVTLNFQGLRSMHYGSILDISAAGLAARIDRFDLPGPNMKLPNIQLVLRGPIVMVNGTLMGSRQNDPTAYVILFDENMNGESKLTIHQFIKRTIQRYMDTLKV